MNGRTPKIEATLSCYSEATIQLSAVTGIDGCDFIHKVLLNHARTNVANQQRIFGAKVDVWICMDIIYDCGLGYTVVHIGNTSKVKLGVTFNE
jgi:hypothetical protein